MWKRVLFSLLVLVSIFTLPWWLTSILLLIGIFIFKFYIEAIAFAFILDVISGQILDFYGLSFVFVPIFFSINQKDNKNLLRVNQ